MKPSQPKKYNKRLITFISIAVVVMILIGAILYILFGRPTQTSEQYDPVSKETVSSPVGKSPENYNQDPNQPLFLGFGDLLSRGITEDQLVAIKDTFTAYSRNNNNSVKQVSLSVDSIQHIIPADNTSDTSETYLSNGVINEKTNFKVTIIAITVTSVQVIIYDQSGKTVLYDSAEATPDSQD